MPTDQKDPGSDIPSPRPPTSTVLLSGGLDSATALAVMAEDGNVPETLFIDYGQPPASEERAAARMITKEYGTSHREIEIRRLKIGPGEIRGRNALLLLAALMTAPETGTVVLATHLGSPYWDCSDDFLVKMQLLFDGYTDGRVQLLAPFARKGKGDLYRLAESLGVPIDLTYSCELASGPCGRCLSCKDAEANAG